MAAAEALSAACSSFTSGGVRPNPWGLASTCVGVSSNPRGLCSIAGLVAVAFDGESAQRAAARDVFGERTTGLDSGVADRFLGFRTFDRPTSFLLHWHREQNYAKCGRVEDLPWVSKSQIRGQFLRLQLIMQRYQVWPSSPQLKHMIFGRKFVAAAVRSGSTEKNCRGEEIVAEDTDNFSDIFATLEIKFSVAS